MHYFHPELSCWLSLCFYIIERALFFPFLKNPHLTFFSPKFQTVGAKVLGIMSLEMLFFLVPVLESRLIVSMKFQMYMWLAGPGRDQNP